MSSEVMSVMARLEGDAAPFVSAWKSGESAAKSLDSAVDSTATSIDASMKDAGKSFDHLGDEAEQGSKEVVDSTDDAADKTEKSSGRMSKALSAAGGAFVALGAAAVAGAVALTAASMSAASYADDILVAADVTNMSTDSLQAYKYAAELLDVPFETMEKSLGKFTKAMGSAQSGTGPAADALARLGVAATNSDGSLRDASTVYWEAMDALGGMTNESERTAAAMELFGRSGAELAPLMAAGSEGFAAFTAEAESVGAIMSGEALSALGAFDDSMQRLKSTTDATKNAIGLTLMPVLDSLAGDGAAAFGELNKALLDANGDLGKAGPAFAEFAKKIVSGLGEAVPMVIDLAVSLVSGLIEGLIGAVPQIAAAVPPMITALVGGIMGMLPAVITAGMQTVVALVGGIAQSLPTLIPVLVVGLLNAVQALIAQLPMLLDAGLQLVMGLAEGLIAALPLLIAALPEIILSIVDFVMGAIPMLIEAGLQLFLSIVAALPDIITGVVAAIPEIIVGVLQAILNALPLLIDAGINLFLALIENLPTIIVSIVAAIPQIIGGIVGALVKAGPQLVSAGGNLIKGLWDGIVGMGDWLWRQMSKFFGGIIDNVKNLLGIHSPSTVFADMGKNLGLGMAQGIEDSTRDVQAAMNDMVAVPSMNSMRLSLAPVDGVQYSGSNPFSQGGSEKITVKQDFHIYSPTSADPLESTKEAAGLMRTGLALAGVGL